MRGPSSKKRFTLMPLIALAGLSLAVTLPTLSATQLHAARPVTYTTVTVRSGDTLWNLADSRTRAGDDVQATVDAIVTANHLRDTGLQPGQQLHIPQ
jgi:LysM repeat protein